MLNETNFRKWLDALRSGKYQQGQGALKTVPLGDGFYDSYDDFVAENVEDEFDKASEYGYCCLGVGCTVAGIKGWEHQALPPPEFFEWLGLDVPDDGLDGPTQHDLRVPRPGGINTTCAALNDDEELTFTEIADLLEENKTSLSVD